MSNHLTNQGWIEPKKIVVIQKYQLVNLKIFRISRASNITFFVGLSSNVRFRFWFNPSEYFQQKGFIPLSRVPSFFEKWQVVIKFLYLLVYFKKSSYILWYRSTYCNWALVKVTFGLFPPLACMHACITFITNCNAGTRKEEKIGGAYLF